MGAIDGKLRQIALVQEATRNTVETLDANTGVKHEGYSFMPKTLEVADETAKGSITGSNERVVIQKWGEGDIPVNMRLAYMDMLAKMITGQAPTSQASGDDYEHTYVLKNDNSHMTHTIFTYDPNAGIKKFAGAMLNQVQLNLTSEQLFKAVLSMLSQAEQSATGTISYDTASEGLFAPMHLGVKIEDDFGDLSAGTIIGCRNIQNTIQKNCEIDWAIHNTNREPEDINNGNIQANGQLTFKYNDTTYKALALGDSYKALEISALDANGHGIKIQYPSVKFTNHTPSTDFNITTETVDFNVDHYDETNGFIQIVLIDGTATH